jgi:hypothetical protein
MSRDMEAINAGMLRDGPLHLLCSVTGDWTDGQGRSVGTTTISGIYKMKLGDRVILAVSAAADTVAIIMLPSVAAACGMWFYVQAVTGSAGGDISLYDEESGGEITTVGDMDDDLDNLLVFSTGAEWLQVYEDVT